MMTKDRLNQNCLGQRFLYKAWSYELYSENALSSTLLIYSAIVPIVLRDYNAAFLWGCWYANMSPSDKKSVYVSMSVSQWFSLILRWPSGGPLVFKIVFKNLLLQNRLANYNQTWHKVLTCEILHWRHLKNLQKHLVNSTKLHTKPSRVKGIQVCLNEEPHPFARRDNH